YNAARRLQLERPDIDGPAPGPGDAALVGGGAPGVVPVVDGLAARQQGVGPGRAAVVPQIAELRIDPNSSGWSRKAWSSQARKRRGSAPLSEPLPVRPSPTSVTIRPCGVTGPAWASPSGRDRPGRANRG